MGGSREDGQSSLMRRAMEGKGTWKDGDLIPTSRSHDQHPKSKLAAYGMEVQVESTWVRRDGNRAVG